MTKTNPNQLEQEIREIAVCQVCKSPYQIATDYEDLICKNCPDGGDVHFWVMMSKETLTNRELKLLESLKMEKLEKGIFSEPYRRGYNYARLELNTKLNQLKESNSLKRG